MKRSMSSPDGEGTKHALSDIDTFISTGGPLQEFYLLPYDNGEPCDVSLLPHNVRKNRYTNVVSTDSKRVLLSRGGQTEEERRSPQGDDAAAATAVTSPNASSSDSASAIGTESSPDEAYLYDLEDGDEEEEDETYVNASWLPGVDAGTHQPSEHAYISTQAPLPSTMDDFWYMAWEQVVAAIIMIGSYTERGIPKIDRYVPSCADPRRRKVTTLECQEAAAAASSPSSSPAANARQSEGATFPEEVPFSRLMFETGAGNIDEDGVLHTRTMNIRCTSETLYTDVGVLERCLSIWPKEVSEQNARTVRHFHLRNWPDHDVPDTTKPLRMFIRRLYSVQQQVCSEDSAPHPLIVHCSAGIGRTGVFCVSHQLMELFLEHRDDVSAATEISISDIVDRFRSCRPGMVQTGQQYQFCYQVVADEARDMGIIPPITPPSKGRATETQHQPASQWVPDCSIL